MRTFFAVNIPEAAQPSIMADIGRLQRQIPGGVRWTRPGHIHLTLKFLGDFDSAHLISLQKQFNPLSQNQAPITLTTSTFGIFPPRGAPRIIWLGVEESRELRSVYNAIEAACEKFGYPREKRPFSPHFTIGRVKRHAEKAQLAQITDAVNKFGNGSQTQFVVPAISFYESTLTPQGPIYNERCKITLCGG